MNTEALRTFLVLSEVGSYTKAAQLLLISQSAISKRIKEMEKELGSELIQRDKKGISLTVAGKKYEQFARKIVELDDASRNALKNKDADINNIKIGCVLTLFETYLTNTLIQFTSSNKGFSIEVVLDSSQYLLNKLYDGSLDICFSYRRFRENNYRCDLFLEDELILVTKGDNPTYVESVTDAELIQLPLIREHLVCVCDRAWIEHIYLQCTCSPLKLEVSARLIPFLKSGLGYYGFVPRSLIQNELKEGSLKAVALLDHEPIILHSYIIYRENHEYGKDILLNYLLKEK